MTGCLIVLAWIFSILTLLKMGLIGTILNEIGQLLIGCSLYLVLPLGCAWGFAYIWTAGRFRLSLRQQSACTLLLIAALLISGLLSVTPDDPWLAVHTLQTGVLPAFEAGSFTSLCGALGALLAGFAVSLFSMNGGWLFAGAFVLLGAVLLFWNQVGLFLALPAQKKREHLREKIPSRPLRLPDASEFDAAFSSESSLLKQIGQTVSSLKPSSGASHQPVSAVFQNGILAGELTRTQTDDPFLQDLDSLSIPQADDGDWIEPDGLRLDAGQRKPAASRPSAGGFTLDEIPDADHQPASSSRPLPAESEDSRTVKTGSRSRKAKPAAQKAPAGHAEAEGAGAAEGKTSRASSAGSAASADPAGSEESRAPLYDPKTYRLPPISLLNDPDTRGRSSLNLKNARAQGARLIEILQQFNVDARLGDIHIGPSVTEFEVIPGQGVRVNTFVNLQSDIKMALAAKDIRIEAPIPGKSAVGIEVPNAEKTAVSMKELIRQVPADLTDKPLVFALGKDLMGDNIYGRLDTMPHLLIAGATGSGKSVCVNSIICSILLRTRPDEVKLLLVDPKKVEFTPYNGIPHLLSPVITDAALASGALKVIVEMMDQRYTLFEELSVRNISSYNEYVTAHPQEERELMPRIVVIIDELADLMLAASKDVEQSIQRITQLARAAGIHLIVATQRPSVNVITGVIKANIPSRIAFMVSSRIDSRTILDQSGAEKLLGYGDMLFLDNGDSTPTRLQGVFIRDQEVEEICAFVKQQASPSYADPFILLRDINESSSGGGEGSLAEDMDPLYPEVKEFVIVSRKASTSLIQRRFRLGYGRAARILDQLEASGIIGPSNGSRPREILVQAPAEDLEGDF